MLETPHVLVGAAIATKIVNPVLVLPLALGSHFILDTIPHWNPHTYTETKKFGKPKKQTSLVAGIDSSLALISGLFIATSFGSSSFTQITVILLASLLAVLPDVSKIPYYYFGRKNGLLKKWVDLERTVQVEVKSPVVGMATQLIICLVALYWITS